MRGAFSVHGCLLTVLPLGLHWSYGLANFSIPLACMSCITRHRSNRSAALLKLNKLAKALADAEECVKLEPAWDKGWMRKGMVLESQGQLLQVRHRRVGAHVHVQ